MIYKIKNISGCEISQLKILEDFDSTLISFTKQRIAVLTRIIMQSLLYSNSSQILCSQDLQF